MSKNFTWPARVYFEDTDTGGVVYYANYLRFLERARSEWLRALGFDQRKLMLETGLGFAVRSVTAEYLKPARLDDELQITCAIQSLGRAQMILAQTVERGTDTLLTATVRLVCMDLARGKAAAVPANIYEAFTRLL
jgi:acyl-CoA thioester hydrolase